VRLCSLGRTPLIGEGTGSRLYCHQCVQIVPEAGGVLSENAFARMPNPNNIPLGKASVRDGLVRQTPCLPR
jgi:hypothetical protein